jgi:hypothetical protein
LCHLFLNQFPYCSIFKLDSSINTIYLKFVIFDFKETKISFAQCSKSSIGVKLPTGTYEISENYSGVENKNSIDEFVFNKSDRCIILKFKLEENYVKRDHYILRFKIIAEYLRLDNKTIEYISEIKFKF